MTRELREMLEMESNYFLSGICEIGGLCFKIPCYSNVMLVSGDSGSGKTYFIKRLKYYLELGESGKEKVVLTDCVDKSRLHVLLHPDELDYLEDNHERHYFIIDRFNLASKGQLKKVQKFIDNKCLLILCTRYSTPLVCNGASQTLQVYVEDIDRYMKYFRFDL